MGTSRLVHWRQHRTQVKRLYLLKESSYGDYVNKFGICIQFYVGRFTFKNFQENNSRWNEFSFERRRLPADWTFSVSTRINVNYLPVTGSYRARRNNISLLITVQTQIYHLVNLWLAERDKINVSDDRLVHDWSSKWRTFNGNYLTIKFSYRYEDNWCR